MLSQNMSISLVEDKRRDFIAKSKNVDKEKDGQTRYQKRIKSKLKANVSNLNKINFNQLFKDNIVTVNLDVVGETSDYVVSVSFGGFLDELHKELSRANDILSLRVIIRSIVNAFNGENVYVRCTCADFRYRFSYYLSVHNLIVGDKETRPSDETNPNDTLGRGCKHIMLVLSNQGWVIKLASVIWNYINYMQKHYEKLYADIIYPKIYNREYNEPVQLDIETYNTDELKTDTQTVDSSNIEGRNRGKFKPGNTFAANRNKNISINKL